MTCGADALDELDHALRFLRPHAGHRLVEQHELRARGEREADFERALLAVGERGCGSESSFSDKTHLRGDRASLVEQRAFPRATGFQNEKLEPLRACTASARLSSTLKRRKMLVIW